MDGDLEFQAVSWLASDVDCEDEEEQDDQEENYGLTPKQSIIRVFGRTASGRSVSLTVSGFRPFLYIKLQDRNAVGRPDAATRLKRRIQERVPRARKETIVVTRHSSKDFWGFQNNQHHIFFKVECSSQTLARQVAFEVRQWRGRDGATDEAALYESNIEPVIRFCHIRDLRPAGWVKVPKGRFSVAGVCDGDGTCELNFAAACKNIFPSQREDIAPLLVASFDLECTSSTGDFPMAIKSCKKLASEMYAEFLKVANSHKSAQLTCVRRCLETSLLGRDAVTDPVASVSPVELKMGRMGMDEARNLINKYVEDLRNILAKTMRSHVIRPKDAPREFDALRAVVTRRSAVRMVGLQGDDQKRSKDEVLNDLDLKLSEILPQLKGDSIIQIGTTFHRYGEQAVSRRHVLTLGGCSEIEGTEVVSCDTEVELMMKWSELIRSSDPDILTGYNILGFDFAYLRDRAQELNIEPLFSRLGRLKGQGCTFREANLSSSALGDNLLRFYDVEGRVVIDIMKVVQRDYKLDTFKLDHVAETFLGERKHDVSPGDIFRMQEGDDEDRRTIAAYCVQDCALCNRLMIKLEILANNMGMANVCLVPLSYIFMRGQGVKIFSLIAKQCSLDGFLVPTRTPEPDFHGVKDTYEGAIVLDPEAGMYLDEVVCVMDYNSLYPSSIIAENLSHDTIVLDEDAYGRLNNVTYGIVSYDVYSSSSSIDGGEARTKIGERRCKYVKEIDGVKHQGVIPRILEQLLRARKETRNRIAHKRVRVLATGEEVCGVIREMHMHEDEYEVLGDAYDDFQKAVLDGLQLAYKVTANSLYGQMGARTSPVYLKDIAACTTAVGRNMIILAKSFMEDYFAARVIYGDSVAGYTPVYVRRDGEFDICTIDELATKYGDGAWTRCVEEGREAKEVCELLGNVETWSDQGWTPLQCVIRHALAPTKKMIRVLTHTGVVDVTDDHSLLTPEAVPIKPKDMSVGDALLHFDLPEAAEMPDTITEAEARIMGFFFGDGSCGVYDWALNNASEDLVSTYIELCSATYGDFEWKVLPTLESSHVYNIVPGARAYGTLTQFIQRYRSIMYHGNAKIIPTAVLQGSVNVRAAFMQGLYDAGEGRTCIPTASEVPEQVESARHRYRPADGDQDVLGYKRIDQKHQISAAHIYWLAGSLGLKASINTRHDKDMVYRVTMTTGAQRKPADAIKKLCTIDYTGYVYDLTTDNHHFSAGVGRLVAHNTDSIFCIFKLEDEQGVKLRGREALARAMEISAEATEAFNKGLTKPQNLEAEKCFYPFCLVSKKRYVGKLFPQGDPDHGMLKSMGLVLKRRDNAHIVKEIYGGVINTIMEQRDVHSSVKFLHRCLNDLVDGKYPMEDLVITKSLRATYSDPTRIAHKVLAERMGERDPGNKPQSSDRIKYVYVESGAKLQGDRIETPEYIASKGLQVDFRHYITNQIMNPVCQLYSIVLEQLPGYRKQNWKTLEAEIRKGQPDAKKASDRVQVLREREVEKLLFTPVLKKLDQRNGERKKAEFVASMSAPAKAAKK